MSLLAAEAQRIKPKDSSATVGQAYPDIDKDGWDDDWVAQFPGANDDAFADPDKDRIPNLFEMMGDADPFTREIIQQRQADPQAAIRLEKRQKASRERNRQALAPYIIDCLRNSEGNPTTRAALTEEKLQRSSEFKARLKAEQPARIKRVESYLLGMGADLPDSMKERLRDVVDGEPRFFSPLGHRQAYLNGVVELWPGGDANTDLTGAGATVAMWDAGGVLETHEQFAPLNSRIKNVDNPGQVNEPRLPHHHLLE